MTNAEIQEQIALASSIVNQWRDWKRNILVHSSQPTNSVAREPVDNRVAETAVDKTQSRHEQASH